MDNNFDNNNSIPKFSFFQKIKNKIISILKPKPQVYLLEMGKTLDIDGKMPNIPLSSQLDKAGAEIDNIASIQKNISQKNRIKNPPEIYSEALITSSSKSNKKTKNSIQLLNEGTPHKEIIIPNNFSFEVRKTLTEDSKPNTDTQSTEQIREEQSTSQQDSNRNNDYVSIQNDNNQNNYIEDDELDR